MLFFIFFNQFKASLLKHFTFLIYINLMEAGCGTGKYSVGFLKESIGKLTMVDASEVMLCKAI